MYQLINQSGSMEFYNTVKMLLDLCFSQEKPESIYDTWYGNCKYDLNVFREEEGDSLLTINLYRLIESPDGFEDTDLRGDVLFTAQVKTADL
jgi:hypothetical protein